MRPIWKGSISFGLVYIPVAVYPATREEKISLRQLRSSDLSPIKYKKVAEADSKEVPADQIVKGFEYERGRYVVMKEEDFEKVRIESTHSIDITDFVELEQVDPKFFYKPYFLEPLKAGEKAYTVLNKTPRTDRLPTRRRLNPRGRMFSILSKCCKRASAVINPLGKNAAPPAPVGVRQPRL